MSKRAFFAMACVVAAVAPIACMFTIPELVTATADAGDASNGEGGSAEAGPSDSASSEGGDVGVPDPSCPSAGGPMIRIEAGAGSFCIDEHEVTLADYVAYLDASSGDAAAQIGACTWNVNLQPNTQEWPPKGDLQVPVSGVDWCDAYLYCARMGKRLCGAIGGGNRPVEDVANPKRAEWYAACSKGGTRKYPYGDQHVNGACVLAPATAPVRVASSPGCEGGYAGMFDMIGNVAEWEDSCIVVDASPGPDDSCFVRGHAFGQPPMTCLQADDTSRTDTNSMHGIRCCAN